MLSLFFCHIVTKYPNASGFSRSRHLRDSHGPVVYPRSPLRETPAKVGRQLVAGFSLASPPNFLPLTAAGAKITPSSAKTERDASRNPFLPASFAWPSVQR